MKKTSLTLLLLLTIQLITAQQYDVPPFWDLKYGMSRDTIIEKLKLRQVIHKMKYGF